MTQEEQRTWARIRSGELHEVKLDSVCMDWSVRYNYGWRAYLRDKRALRERDAVRTPRRQEELHGE